MDELKEIGLVACWYKEKSCGNFAYKLSAALERLGLQVRILSANCRCYGDDPFNPELSFSPVPRIPFADFYPKPGSRIKRVARLIPQHVGDVCKGARYLKHLKLPILNYQQTQGSFGFLPLLSFLSFPTESKRVVTIHEIDSTQRQFKLKNFKLTTIKLNKIYNKADAVIVQTSPLKKQLEGWGIQGEKIHIIPHGTTIPPLHSDHRDQIIFCGGHHLAHGKGFDLFLKALVILKEKGITPPVLIHGLNREYGQEEGIEPIAQMGLTDQIKWFDYVFTNESELFAEYQKSLLAVIPYTSSEAGATVTTAMANAVPVIASRSVGLPDYLGQEGIFVKEDDPAGLAEAMLRLIQDPLQREELGRRLVERATGLFSWEAIARQNIELYQAILT
ncbi:MAG: glycosyltransferase family 4 protein [Pseudomonadota bacterium]